MAKDAAFYQAILDSFDDAAATMAATGAVDMSINGERIRYRNWDDFERGRRYYAGLLAALKDGGVRLLRGRRPSA